jgi:Domain of unknown function (DUF4291)
VQLIVEPYRIQTARWAREGQQILAQFDETSIVVYQAYRSSIGQFAAAHGYFGGSFSFTRMSWIKPNFLWMMFRSGWGSKEGQEVVLAISLKRAAFDSILAQAVHSIFHKEVYGSEAEWKRAVEQSDVRLQWDPDHDPSGGKLERRTIQLGLRGSTLSYYARDWIIDIQDISSFVQQQHHYAQSPYSQLVTPREMTYPVADAKLAARLGVSTITPT